MDSDSESEKENPLNYFLQEHTLETDEEDSSDFKSQGFILTFFILILFRLIHSNRRI